MGNPWWSTRLFDVLHAVQGLRKAYNPLYCVVAFCAVVLEQVFKILLTEAMFLLLFVEKFSLFFFSFRMFKVDGLCFQLGYSPSHQRYDDERYETI